MKKSIIAICLLFVLFVPSSCGKKTALDVSMYDLSRAMLGATEFGEMSYVSSSDSDPADLLSNVSDIDYSKVSSFFIAYAKEGKGNADEIVVISVKDPADAEAAKASLERHLETRKSMYATYDPTQSEKIGAGVVFTRNNFAVLTVSGDNGAVRAAFDAFIDEAEKADTAADTKG